MSRGGIFLLRLLMWAVVAAYLAVSVWYYRDMSVSSDLYEGLDVKIQDSQKFVDRSIVGSWLDSINVAYAGKPSETLPLYDIERILGNKRYVEKVQVFRDMGGHCIVELSQREVFLRVVSDRGHDFFVDTSGYRLDPRGVWQKDVPVVTTDMSLPFGPKDYGGNYRGYADTMLYFLKNLRNFVNALEKDAFLGNLVTQTKLTGNISPGSECMFLIPRLGTQRIVLGPVSDIQDKLANVSLFYRKTFSDKWWQDASQVCFQYGNKIVVKRK